MARYVEPDRLWPLLAFFAGAVVVVVAADLVIDAVGASRDAMVWVVLGWFVLVPVGAWAVWKKSGGEGRHE